MQVEHNSSTPRVESACVVNWLKLLCFQTIGFELTQHAPLHPEVEGILYEDDLWIVVHKGIYFSPTFAFECLLKEIPARVVVPLAAASLWEQTNAFMKRQTL